MSKVTQLIVAELRVTLDLWPQETVLLHGETCTGEPPIGGPEFAAQCLPKMCPSRTQQGDHGKVTCSHHQPAAWNSTLSRAEFQIINSQRNLSMKYM